MPYVIALIIWCIAGTVFFFKTFEGVEKVLKMILLILISGPVIWILAILSVLIDFFCEKLPEWFKS